MDASEGAPATPVAWSVAVDPATDAPTIPPDRDVNIAIPEGPNPQIVFPATPSTMVCVGNVGHGREHREIWDLRTNLKLGTTRGLRTLSENLGGFFKPISALSPDGRVFVTQGLRPFDLVVWDVAAEKQIGVVIPEHAPTAGLTFAAFARPERLVACGIGTPFQMLGIAIPSRTRMRKFPREHEYDRNSLAIIRGGRYLSVFDKSKLLLRIYDSESAMPVGQLSLPPFVPAAPMNCDCVAFSSDRQELAALFSYNSRSYLACWDLRNGRLTDRIDFGGNLRAFLGARFAYLDPPLEWFPDRRHWLVYGQGIVDRRAGKLIWQIPDEPTRMPHGIRHVAGSDCVLSVVNENGRFVLRSLRLRLKDIDRAAQAPGGFNEKIRN